MLQLNVSSLGFDPSVSIEFTLCWIGVIMSARVAFLALISTTFATSIWASVAGKRTAITQVKEIRKLYSVIMSLNASDVV